MSIINELLTVRYYYPVDRDGNWPDAVRLIYEEACLTTILAYVAIALSLLVCSSLEHCSSCHVVVSVRSRIATAWVAVILLLSVATGQIENIVTFYWPAYTFFTVLQVVNAGIAWGVAWWVFRTRCKLLFRI